MEQPRLGRSWVKDPPTAVTVDRIGAGRRGLGHIPCVSVVSDQWHESHVN